MVVGTRRRYLRQHYRYELMLGTTFHSIGAYLDACCSRNSSTDEGCTAWLQCRKWWDKKCNRTRSNLSEAEIVQIVVQFEERRERWLVRNPPSASLTERRG
jgi:hypothetical protein